MNYKFCSLFFAAIFLLQTPIVFADTSITNLVFTSAEQVVVPSVISKQMTVQTQNSTGGSVTTTETNDATFSSNSPTGEFSSNSTNWVPVTTLTMNKGSANKNFYYKDSSTGNFTITVKIKGRETGNTFEASQSITISSETPTDTSTSTPTTTATSTPSTTATTTSTTSSTGTLSSHSNTQVITYVVNNAELKADAGRHRITTVKSPIEFEAKTSGLDNSSSKLVYSWSFGDGKSETGKTVTHTYMFNGDYNVVLNVTSGDKHAVSRTEVKVIPPEVAIVNIEKGLGGFVELKNNSAFEVNLGGWEIAKGAELHVFPEDTIMMSHASVKFPFEFLGAGNDSVSLSYESGIKILESIDNTYVASEASFDDDTDAVVMARKQKALENLRKYERGELESSFVVAQTPTPQTVLKENVVSETVGIVASSSDQTALLIDAFNSSQNADGADSSILSIPKKVSSFIKNLFSQ